MRIRNTEEKRSMVLKTSDPILTAVIAGEETQRIVVGQTQSATEKLKHYLLIVYPAGRIPARRCVYNM